jgi:hypothetical protein
MSEVLIYQREDGQSAVEVRLEQDTLWLSQAQIAVLFDKDSDTIGLHLRNVYESGELDEKATTEESSVVRQEGKRQVRRTIRFYNLDAIISIGYRVNSKKGTQFRIWANRVLKDYLVQGYALNQQRLEAQQEKMAELKQAIALSARLIHNKELSNTESQGILAILEKYSHALTVLDDYDHQRLQVVGTRTRALPKIAYAEAMQQILLWRQQENLGGLFGNEKDESFKSSMETIRSYIPASKRRRRICCTSSSRTTRSPMATKESLPRYSSGSCSATIFCITPRVKSALPIMHWLPSRC